MENAKRREAWELNPAPYCHKRERAGREVWSRDILDEDVLFKIARELLAGNSLTGGRVRTIVGPWTPSGS
jgi:hypothetical protein